MNIIRRYFSFFFVASAILGYAAGYGKIYLFHLLSITYLLMIIIGLYKINRQSLIIISILLSFFTPFFLYALYSNKTNTINYIFYYICALSCFLFTSNLKTNNEIKYTYKYIALFLFINLLFGSFESLELIRLPFSPYSEHFSYFGRSLEEINPNLLNSSRKNYPTGFNFNQNNFGFVALISFPFFFLHKNNLIKITSLVFCIIISLNIGSKGFIFSLILLFLSYFILYAKIKYKTCISFFLVFITILLLLFDVDIYSTNRSFTVFEQIFRGIDLMLSSNTSPIDSTSERAYIYSLGIKELINSYGFGLGIGGISELLSQQEGIVSSFHFFFLEFIIDFGIYISLPILFLYFSNIFNLVKKSKEKIGFESYLCKSTSLSLLIAFPASISPSSIIYILTFWTILGFSISLRKT